MFEAVLVGAFLGILLFTEYFRARSRSIASAPDEIQDSPLDVDSGLSLPWAGHASSVFSLTALFGAYLGIFLILGVWAIAGILLGSLCALFSIRYVILNSGEPSFKKFLNSRKYSFSMADNRIFAYLVSTTQLLFAVSELIILRELAINGFFLSPRDATVYAGALALVAYFYCLLGGYRALYHTDAVQLVFVILMCSLTGGYLLLHIGVSTSTAYEFNLGMFRKSWSIGLESTPALVAVRLVVGFIMGWSFLVASPDTWKRVHTISHATSRRKHWFWAMIVAGTIPFLFLIPLVVLLTNQDSETIFFTQMMFAQSNRIVSLAILIGLTASFMSSFDSSLMAATHVHLEIFGTKAPQYGEKVRFQGTLATVFLLACLWAGVLSLGFAGNPYFLALMLIGPYALIGGIVTGTLGLSRPIRHSHFWEELLVYLLVWLVGLHTITTGLPTMVRQLDPNLAEAVPFGAILFVFVAVAAFLRSQKDAEGNRRQS